MSTDDEILDMVFANTGNTNTNTNTVPSQSTQTGSFNIDSIGLSDSDISMLHQSITAAAHSIQQSHQHIQQHINNLSTIIERYNNQSSLYHSRAQLYIALKQYNSAIDDLTHAIQYSQQYNQFNIYRDSLMQRGTCYLLLHNNGNSSDDTDSVEYRAGMNDLSIASELGCTTSKQLLQANNPYAKLCSNMVSAMMKSQLTGNAV